MFFYYILGHYALLVEKSKNLRGYLPEKIVFGLKKNMKNKMFLRYNKLHTLEF